MSHDNPFDADFDRVNPYAIRRTQIDDQRPQVPSYGIWRQGKLLVMHKDAVLPDICIKSNEPISGYRLKRKLTYHHPAIALAILVNVLLYIILASVLSKRATVMIGLSDRWRSIRLRRMVIGWVGFLTGVVLFIWGCAIADDPRQGSQAGLLLVGGILVGLGFGIYGLLASRMISAKKIDNEYVYIRGVAPAFLDRFEPQQA